MKEEDVEAEAVDMALRRERERKEASAETVRAVRRINPAAVAMSQHVGQAIRLHRLLNHMSQEDLAEATARARKAGVGVTIPRHALAAIEAGERRVNVDELPSLCHAFGVGVEELLRGPTKSKIVTDGVKAMFPAAGKGGAAMTYAELASQDYIAGAVTAILDRELEARVRNVLASVLGAQS
jgi:transcriptional regulator with XRE-family HTH domain